MDVRRILFLLWVAGGLAVGALLFGAGPGFAVAPSVPRPAVSGAGVEARVEVYPPAGSMTPSPPAATATSGVLPVTGTSGRGPLLETLAGIGALVVGAGLVLLVRRRRPGPTG
jgi:hypothetical protein